MDSALQNDGLYSFPSQRLSSIEKDKEWREQCVEAITRMKGVNTWNTQKTMRINYNLMVNKIDDKDFKHLTDLYKDVKGGFPAKFSKANILKSKIDVLLGEKISRIFDFKVVATDESSVNKASEKKGEMIMQMLNQMWMQELQQQGVNVNDPNAMQQQITPEYIQHYMKYTYVDMREDMAQKALQYLVKYCNVQDCFKDGWYDLLVAGYPIFWVGVVNGEPRLDRVNPENFDYQKSPDTKYIDDSEWCKHWKKLTLSDIYDDYYKDLTEKDKESLDQLRQGFSPFGGNNNMNTITIRNSDIDDPDNFYNNKWGNSLDGLIDVFHVVWKSKRKIGFLKFMDDNGMLQETTVSEEYRLDKTIGDISIDWDWINETWEGTKIGNDIYVNIRPLPFQDISLDNPSKTFFPYTGGGLERNTEQVSLVEIMKPLLYDYIEILYRLKLSIARSKDKVMLMDVAQIPRSQGFSIEKWLYYMDVLGIAFINSFEEGENKFEGRTSAFNQFQSFDMSMARIIDQYVLLLDKIEDMMGQISGVNRQREGSITQNDLASTTERAVVQSSHITEKYFSHMYEIERRALEMLLQVSKQAWIEGKKAQYILPDMSREILSIDGGLLNDAEFGVFVSNSSKDTAALNSMKSLAGQAIQGGAKLSQIAEIMTSESMVFIKHKMREIEDMEAQREQQQQQMQQQMQQEALAQQEKHHQEDMQLKKYEIDTKASTDIYKAEITTQIGKEDGDQDNDGQLDAVEMAKVALQQRKIDADIMLEKLGLQDNDKQRQHEKEMHKQDLQMKDKEIAVKKIAAKKKPTSKK